MKDLQIYVAVEIPDQSGRSRRTPRSSSQVTVCVANRAFFQAPIKGQRMLISLHLSLSHSVSLASQSAVWLRMLRHKIATLTNEVNKRLLLMLGKISV